MFLLSFYVIFVCSQRVKNAHAEVTEARQLDIQREHQADESLGQLVATFQLTAVWKSGKLILGFFASTQNSYFA